MQPVYCSSCGKSNVADAKFCNECASPLFYAQPVQQEQPQFVEQVAQAPGLLGWWRSLTGGTKFVFAAIAAMFVIAIIAIASGERLPPPASATKPSTVTAPPPTRTELNATVRFNGTQFIIVNKESVDLTNVKMEINGGLFSGGYELKQNRLKANETYTVGAMQFADSDGKRFNPFQMKPKKFTISADSSIGHLFLVGGWD